MNSFLLILLHFLGALTLICLSIVTFGVILNIISLFKLNSKIGKWINRNLLIDNFYIFNKKDCSFKKIFAINGWQFLLIMILCMIYTTSLLMQIDRDEQKEQTLYSNKYKEYQYTIDSLKIVINDNHLHELIGKYHLLKDNKDILNKQTLYDFVVECGAWYPDIIVKQAILESGNFSSNVYKRTNNLFGMKLAKSRNTTRNIHSKELEYADFYNWQLSVIDRILWDYAIFDSIPTREKYLKKLQKIYAEDKDYINKIK